MTVRARVWGAGRVGDQTVWHYAVLNSAGETVLYDNTCGFDRMLHEALVRVEALRHMETAGHRLNPYKGRIG